MLRYQRQSALSDSVTKTLTIQRKPVRDDVSDGANSDDRLTRAVHGKPSRRALIEEALEHILSSRAIGRSARHRAFLRHIVGATLDGQYERLKESTIALEVFQRDAAHYDSTTDAIVRVEAARIRQKLDRYYAAEGAGSTLRVEMVAGNYRPRFVDHATSVQPTGVGVARGFSVAERGAIPSDITRDALAMYERALYMMRARKLESYRSALALFESAIEREPLFAAAYRGVAWARISIAGHVGVPPEAGNQGSAMAAAIERARAIDPENPDVDTLRGAYASRFQVDFEAAQSHYESALARHSEASGARSSYAWLLTLRGHFEEAQQMFDAEFARDPFAFFMRHNLGMLAYFRRDFTGAERIFSEALEMEPGHLHVRISRASVLIAMGDANATVAEISGCWADNQILSGVALERVRALAATGRQDEAKTALTKFDIDFKDRYFSPVYRSAAHLAMGEIESALTWLDRAVSDRDYWLVNVRVDPAFDRLRNAPKYLQAMKRAGLH